MHTPSQSVLCYLHRLDRKLYAFHNSWLLSKFDYHLNNSRVEAYHAMIALLYPTGYSIIKMSRKLNK